ncbi:hypothetical protein KUCAC02_035070 [Chaenocephalus aceratus]|nr:hypothetical protein KUCAC02_035070 [Chaenocephalus aceratus]
METPRRVLLRIVQSLGEKDFKEFKWRLQEEVLGFPGLPKSPLEKADRMDTVDLMFLYHCVNTTKVTRDVLRQMNQNDLEEKLSKIPSDPKGWTKVESRGCNQV